MSITNQIMVKKKNCGNIIVILVHSNDCLEDEILAELSPREALVLFNQLGELVSSAQTNRS